jgi:hypothetical protein
MNFAAHATAVQGCSAMPSGLMNTALPSGLMNSALPSGLMNSTLMKLLFIELCYDSTGREGVT